MGILNQRRFCMVTRKVGRDAGSGKFIPVKTAERNKGTAVVETIKVAKPATKPPAQKK
jgi:hypothetical protein